MGQSPSRLPESLKLKLKYKKDRDTLMNGLPLKEQLLIHKYILRVYIPEFCRNLGKNLYRKQLLQIAHDLHVDLKNLPDMSSDSICNFLYSVSDNLEKYIFSIPVEEPWTFFNVSKEEFDHLENDYISKRTSNWKIKFTPLHILLLLFYFSGVSSMKTEIQLDPLICSRPGISEICEIKSIPQRLLVLGRPQRYFTEDLPELVTPVDKHVKESIIKKTIGHVKPSSKPIAIILAGGPGTGKGSIQSILLKDLNMSRSDFVVLDSDAVMEQLPGYQQDINYGTYKGVPVSRISSAFKWHDMASDITKEIQSIVLDTKRNAIFDGTAKNKGKTLGNIERLKKDGYYVILASPVLDTSIAKERAVKRSEGSGRFVPMTVIDEIAEEVQQNIPSYQDVVDESFIYSTDTNPPQLLEHRRRENFIPQM